MKYLFRRQPTAMRLLLATLFICLPACGMFADAPQPPPAKVLSPLETYLVTAAPGESTLLNDPQFGENIRVSVEGGFASANGQNCRRGTVIASNRDAEVVVICQDEHNQWQTAPRVWGQGLEGR